MNQISFTDMVCMYLDRHNPFVDVLLSLLMLELKVELQISHLKLVIILVAL